MKFGTMCRLVGMVQSLIFGTALYHSVYQQRAYEIIAGEYPLTAKVVAGACVVVPTAATALGTADGLVDIIKGTHHYLLLTIKKYVSRSEETQQEIERAVQRMQDLRESEISDIT